MRLPITFREFIIGVSFAVMSGPIAMGILWYFQAESIGQLPTVAFVAVVWLQAFPWIAGHMITDNPFLEKPEGI